MQYSFVLLSGGNGSRMRQNCPKQYLLLGGKPMIMHTIERASALKEISEIIIVCEEKYKAEIDQLLQQYNIKKKIVYAPAGGPRQESVYNALQFVSEDNLILHEAARPFVTPQEFLCLINCSERNVSYASKITFTVVKGNEYIVDILNRSELRNIQLPQKFETTILLEAHKEAIKEHRSFTEDASMVTFYKKADVKLLEGSSYNIKMTEPIDLILGEMLYKEYFLGRK